MNDLQVGLLMVGVVVLLIFAAYSTWQVSRRSPKQAKNTALSDWHPPVVKEPSLVDAGVVDRPFGPPVLSFPEKKPGLDALIDAIAPIALDAPLTGRALLSVIPHVRRIGSKPFAIEGQNQSTLRWEFPVSDQFYTQLQTGVQLANRSGALTDIEFSEFIQKTQRLAETVNGTPNVPMMHTEVNRARELDQFASDHDAQLRFVLRAQRSTWSPSYVLQTAARHGFVAGGTAGRMVMPASSAGMPSILSLTFDVQAAMADNTTQSVLNDVVLTLDVTHVNRHEFAFDKMRKAALMLASDMEGSITDDNGVVLTEAAMETIADEMAHLYDALDRCEFSAGSPLARRLFS